MSPFYRKHLLFWENILSSFSPPPNENFSLLLFGGFDDCFRFQNNNNNNNYFSLFFPIKNILMGKNFKRKSFKNSRKTEKTKQKNHFVSQTHTHTQNMTTKNKTKKFCTEFHFLI